MSPLAVAATDAIAHVSCWFLIVVWGMPVIVLVSCLLEIQCPKESWTEIGAGIAAITLVIFGVVRYRTRRINDLLETGVAVPARLERYFHFQWNVNVVVSFEWHGRPRKKRFLLAYGKRSRNLETMSEVTLAIDSANPRRAVIRDLYFDREPAPDASGA